VTCRQFQLLDRHKSPKPVAAYTSNPEGQEMKKAIASMVVCDGFVWFPVPLTVLPSEH